VSRRLSLLVVAGLVAGLVASAPPAAAHRADLVKAATRVGPIRFGVTTLRETRAHFGDPTSRKRVRLGCIRAVRVRWGNKLQVMFTTDRPHVAIEGTVRKRTIRSQERGPLTFHTGKGLRVGDRGARLRRLYPNVSPVRHGRHWDHFLVPSARFGRLVAITKTRRGKVAALFSGPYENC
jgi:hypothetical protein